MASPSPSFTINGGAPDTKASVAASAAVTATLDDISGVRSVVWSISRVDETSLTTDYVLVQTGSVGQTVDTTALLAGTAAVLKCVINGGIDVTTDRPSSNTIQENKFFVPLATSLEVLCSGELDSSGPTPDRISSATHGAADPINAALRLSGAGDADAIHDNVADEILAVTEKSTLVAADLILIEDSEAAGVKKRVQLSNLSAVVASTDITVGSVDAEAFVIREGPTNAERWFLIDTSNNDMYYGVSGAQSCTHTFYVSANNTAFRVLPNSGGGTWLSMALTGNGLFRVGDGSGRNPRVEFQIADNQNESFFVEEGNNDYVNVDTRTGVERISLGNTATDPDLAVLGQGAITLGETGATVGFMGASAVAVRSLTGALDSITDANTRAVLQSVIDALVIFGLATDDTT